MSLFLMQPNFLPWIGFFDMVMSCEKLVFLDDVQFSKGSWVNRNRIKTKKGLEWITIPIDKIKKEKKIADLKIFKKKDTFNKISHSITQNYNKSDHFHVYKKEFLDLLGKTMESGSISKLNQDLIIWILKKMKIKKKIFKASDLQISGNKIERIIDICKKLDEKNYLTTSGAYDYLNKEINYFDKNKINVLVHNYQHPVYKQLYGDFSSHASIIDLLFNEGKKSLDILKSGRLKPLSLKKL